MNQEINHYGNQAVDSQTKEKHLLNDEHFQKIMKLKDEVYNATEVNPTIRKLLFLIIEKSNLEEIKNQLIQQYS